MALIKEVDEVATIKNVRRFFKYEFPKFQQMAHISYVDVQSPVISGMPSGGSYGNTNDEKVTLHVNAKNILEAVLEACRGMRKPHRDVMELYYFKDWKIYQIQNLLDYSESRIYQIIDEAFLQFAWGFQEVDDLIVFK